MASFWYGKIFLGKMKQLNITLRRQLNSVNKVFALILKTFLVTSIRRILILTFSDVREWEIVAVETTNVMSHSSR